MKKELLSIIVLAYNEEQALQLFIEEAEKYTRDMPVDVEYIFVNDGSSDDTFAVLEGMSRQNDRVFYISFSRNFGKEAAMYAGLEYARGDYVAIMDADLQDPPALLPEMYRLIVEEQYDCVGSRRIDRKGEPPIRSFFARLFYRIMNNLSQMDIVDGSRDFQMMKRKVVDAILRMPERNRFSKGIFGWIGFRKKWLEYENVERVAGEMKWSFWKLLIYALDGIIAFSTIPLVIASLTGLVFCFIALMMIIFIIVKTLVFGDPTSGWPSLACIIMFVSGIQLFCVGILGQYLSKIYIETKNRPIYLVDETNITRDGRYEKAVHTLQ
ncbi:MAG: glycosyltransferase family 2 protein [Clostridiales bacterium]|nr:glycosyltransferase family 2 protein [Clostridiales bacterium]